MRKILAGLFIIFGGLVIGNVALSAETTAKPAKTDDKGYKGGITIGSRYTGVNDDEGRFREDHYQKDDFSGGLERLWFDGTSGKTRLEMDLKSIYDDNYSADIKATREDFGYVHLQFDRDRRYYDGSNEAWDPTPYGLSKKFAEMDDEEFYTDRINSNLEIGFTPVNGPEIVIGWHRWQRQGEEVLLRGGRARVTGDVSPRMRAIPAYKEVDGTSDKFYFDISQTFKEKYNLRYRQEYENYRDNQQVLFSRYKDGVRAQYRNFEDEPRFRELTSMLMFDSQVKDNVYIASSYMHNDLNNKSTRDRMYPTSINTTKKEVQTEVHNKIISNVWTTGIQHSNLLKVKGLESTLSFRYEDAGTDAESYFLNGGTNPFYEFTDLKESWLSEDLTIVYRGWTRTVLSFEADLEQRDLNWTELTDMRSSESVTEFGFKNVTTSSDGYLHYDTDIEHRNYTYTFKGVHRFNDQVKFTSRYRYKDKNIDYDTKIDNNPLFFPGVLGDLETESHEFSLGTDITFNKAWKMALKYNFLDEDRISNASGGKNTQEFENHRYALSLVGAPLSNLVIIGSLMYDDYKMNTPTNIPAGNKWKDGSSAYDFNGDAFTTLLNVSYALTQGVTITGDGQYTDSTGTNNYNSTKLGLGVKLTPTKNQTIKFGYEYYNFNDDTGSGFDDYDSNGGYITYGFTF